MNDPSADSRSESPEVRHEPEGIHLRAILTCGGALVVVAVFIHISAWCLFRHLEAVQGQTRPSQFPLATLERQQRTAPQTEPTPPGWNATQDVSPPPRAPVLEGIERLRGRPSTAPGMARNAYEWVDRMAGVVRIPLEEAMALIVEKGLLPARTITPGESPDALPQPPSRANSGRTREGGRP
jgi:hypothetical protein